MLMKILSFWDDDAYYAMTITSTSRRRTTMTLKRRWTSPTPTPSTTLRSMTTSLRPMSRPSTSSTSFAHQGDFSLWLQWFKAPSPMAKVESPWHGQRKVLWKEPTSEGFGKVSCRSCPWKIAVLALWPVWSPSKRLTS